jgi:hypothetical protein
MLGFALAIPALLPIGGISAAMVRLTKSERRWQRALANALIVALIPLFLMAVLIFIPYYALLRLLAALGLARMKMPPSLAVVEDGRLTGGRSFWRLDLAVPDDQPQLASKVITDLLTTLEVPVETPVESVIRSLDYGLYKESSYQSVHIGWSLDQGTLSAEISIEGDPQRIDSICRNFVAEIEENHPSVEVQR